MPKATLKFSLPEEQEEYENAVHGVDAFILIHELEEYFRRRFKHVDIPAEMTAEQMWDSVVDKFFELRNERIK